MNDKKNDNSNNLCKILELLLYRGLIWMFFVRYKELKYTYTYVSIHTHVAYIRVYLERFPHHI